MFCERLDNVVVECMGFRNWGVYMGTYLCKIMVRKCVLKTVVQLGVVEFAVDKSCVYVLIVGGYSS